MRKIRLLPVLLIMLACAACKQDTPPPESRSTVAQAATGGDWLAAALADPAFRTACDLTPGCASPAGFEARDTEDIWRVIVRRAADGAVEIGPPDRTRVLAGSGLPLAMPGGDLVLVARGPDSEVIATRALRFPTRLRLEYEGGSAPRTIPLDNHTVDTVAYLRSLPGMVRLEVLDAAGAVLATRELPRQSAALREPSALRWLGIGEAHASTGNLLDVSPQCAHILILQGEEDRELGEGMQWGTASSLWNEWIGEDDSIRLLTPGPYQLAATKAALSRMTPLLCQSVGRIAFGSVPTSRQSNRTLAAVASATAGDMIVVNANANNMTEEALEQREFPKLQLQTTLIHEAGHAAENLLTVEGANGGSYHGEWNDAAHELAKKTVDNVRLEVGLAVEWGRLHASFQQQGWASPSGLFPEGTDENPATWTHIDLVKAGYISRYASDGVFEDIADHVVWSYMSQPVRDAYAANNAGEHLREDSGCLEMRNYTEPNLPAQFAAVYTKLHFLLDLGLVRPEGVRDCTGENLGLHVESQGFHVWQNGVLLRSFDRGLKAHLGTTGVGAKVFELEAEGGAEFANKSYPAKVKLRLGLGSLFDDLDRLSWPRGIYPLGLALGHNNNFQLRLDGAPAGNFDAKDGFVLVAESSSRRIAGSVVVQRVMRLNAPIPVPELYDPPLVVRFMIEK